MPNGTIVDAPTIIDHGDPAKRFDIVILGEGFRQRDLALFDRKAKALAKGLLATHPFDEVAHLINVHTVRTISIDSGVSDFASPNDRRKTYYQVRGRFPAPDVDTPASYLGTDRPEIILGAAGEAAPLETIELCIVLCNLKPMAASAPPNYDIIYTGLQGSDAEMVDYAAHEACHVMVHTAEEYLDGDGPRPNQKFPNQVTEAQRRAGNVWWKSLATPGELDSSGGFRAVHTFGDPNVHFTARLHTPVFDATPSFKNNLGLFWGCQDVDDSAPPDPNLTNDQIPYEDGRGQHFYRPMAACKMRHLKSDFCRVCSWLIVQRVHEFAI